MSTNLRAALERWRDLVDTDLLCPENPAEIDWGAVAAAIAATRAALAQPEGQSMLNVNLKLDTSPECLKRLVDGLTKAVTPNGGYEAATTDDPAPGTGGDQMVQVQWWIPQHGCDSLENTLDAIKYRIGRAVEDWWATALVPAALAKPEGEGLTNDEALRRGRPATPPPLPSNYIDPEHQGEELKLLQTFYRACRAEGGTADEIYLKGIRAVLAARPAAPPAPEMMEAVGNCARIELVVALHSLASQFENKTAAFTGDDLKAVQGHIRHARKIAARYNQNGPGCAPPAPEAGEVGEVVVSEWDNGFMAGVCAALAVVKYYDDGTVWKEIVRSVGTDYALNYAANVNPEDWELAGFSTYAQSELGKGKPDPLPQAGEVQS